MMEITKRKITILILIILLVFTVLAIVFKFSIQPRYGYIYWEDVELRYNEEEWDIDNYNDVTEQSLGDNTINTAGALLVNKNHITIIFSLGRGEFPPSNAQNIGWYDIPGIDDAEIISDKTSLLDEYGIISANDSFICMESLGVNNSCIFLTSNVDSEYYASLEMEGRLFAYKFEIGSFDNSTIQVNVPKDLDVTQYNFEEELELISDFLQRNK